MLICLDSFFSFFPPTLPFHSSKLFVLPPFSFSQEWMQASRTANLSSCNILQIFPHTTFSALDSSASDWHNPPCTEKLLSEPDFIVWQVRVSGRFTGIAFPFTPPKCILLCVNYCKKLWKWNPLNPLPFPPCHERFCSVIVYICVILKKQLLGGIKGLEKTPQVPAGPWILWQRMRGAARTPAKLHCSNTPCSAGKELFS